MSMDACAISLSISDHKYIENKYNKQYGEERKKKRIFNWNKFLIVNEAFIVFFFLHFVLFSKLFVLLRCLEFLSAD